MDRGGSRQKGVVVVVDMVEGIIEVVMVVTGILVLSRHCKPSCVPGGGGKMEDMW